MQPLVIHHRVQIARGQCADDFDSLVNWAIGLWATGPAKNPLRAGPSYARKRIADIIGERKLTKVRAAKPLGIDQPKVSALLRGKLDGFSTERLFRLLNALGRDVEIVYVRGTPYRTHTPMFGGHHTEITRRG